MVSPLVNSGQALSNHFFVCSVTLCNIYVFSLRALRLCAKKDSFGSGYAGAGSVLTGSEGNMRVLIIGNFLSGSGSNPSVCEDLAERLGARGWRVSAASTKRGRLARLMDMAGTAWKQRNRYAVAQVDVFSGPSFIWAETVCWTLRRASRPFVLTLHGGNLPAFAGRWPHRFRRLVRSAAAVTTPSRYLLEQVKSYREGMVLLPNALDLGRYAFSLRREVRPSLVWLRAFHEIYNPVLAPRVLARLSDLEGSRLVMAGPDKGDGSLQRAKHAALQLCVADRVFFPGRIQKDEVPDFLQKGNIFINTADVDNTPVSVMEAMACGLCIVSTKVGGIPYLLEHGHDSLLVPPDDPEAMAAAIRRIILEPGLSEKLSRHAREKAESFDWSRILPQWEELLIKAQTHGKR